MPTRPLRCLCGLASVLSAMPMRFSEKEVRLSSYYSRLYLAQLGATNVSPGREFVGPLIPALGPGLLADIPDRYVVQWEGCV